MEVTRINKWNYGDVKHKWRDEEEATNISESIQKYRETEAEKLENSVQLWKIYWLSYWIPIIAVKDETNWDE